MKDDISYIEELSERQLVALCKAQQMDMCKLHKRICLMHEILEKEGYVIEDTPEGITYKQMAEKVDGQ